ncbi:hypothetical protein AKJ63_00160 [candidate division MSBL1 archaeon SCGC-AAA259D18]|uniref:Uncharacterized protein n=1 Tax=candidate division MSBL1 archaeon SCGC-AAA259D18 TaxID=1698262 RepID=A0A133UCT3_9EURY|nr:hypothetical protein AKJ63_00160 [candidate division MSBL1 archaeon SCGC-AAA259D18]
MDHRGGSGDGAELGLKEEYSGNAVLDLLHKYGRGELLGLIAFLGGSLDVSAPWGFAPQKLS